MTTQNGASYVRIWDFWTSQSYKQTLISQSSQGDDTNITFFPHLIDFLKT